MSEKNNGFDDIRQIRREIAKYRGERDAVIREHLASVTDESAIVLIRRLGWGLCNRLKITRRLLEDHFNYDFPSQRFLKDSSEAAFANEKCFHVVKNNHALLLIAQKELDTVVKAKEATNASSPKEIYVDSLKAILLAWERIGVVITYNDLLEIVKNEFIQQYNDLTSFPQQWLAGYLSSWISLSPKYRLSYRLMERFEGETSRITEQDYTDAGNNVKMFAENELITDILCEISSCFPELKSYADVGDLLCSVKKSIDNESAEQKMSRKGKPLVYIDTIIRDESGEVLENDIADQFDLEEEVLAKEDASCLLKQAQEKLSQMEFQVLLLDIAHYDKKLSLRKIAEILDTTIKTVDSCRRRSRKKLINILYSTD